MSKSNITSDDIARQIAKLMADYHDLEKDPISAECFRIQFKELADTAADLNDFDIPDFIINIVNGLNNRWWRRKMVTYSVRMRVR